MSFEIKRESAENRIILGEEVSIAEARDFHSAVLSLALEAIPLVVDASAVRTIHTSILQVLYALKVTSNQFVIHGASVDFTTALERLGLDLLSPKKT